MELSCGSLRYSEDVFGAVLGAQLGLYLGGVLGHLRAVNKDYFSVFWGLWMVAKIRQWRAMKRGLGVKGMDEGCEGAAMVGFLAWWCGNGGFNGMLGREMEA